MAPYSAMAIDSWERKVLIVFAVAAPLVGLGAAAVLAARIDDRTTIPTDYWDNLLTIAGVASLPIVAMVVLVVRSATQSHTTLGGWGAGMVLGAVVAFAVSMMVITICLFQIVVAADAAASTTPAAPDPWVIWLATMGTGFTLSAVAVGVAAAALDLIDDA